VRNTNSSDSKLNSSNLTKLPYSGENLIEELKVNIEYSGDNGDVNKIYNMIVNNEYMKLSPFLK
jgi:hypothetical protein